MRLPTSLPCALLLLAAACSTALEPVAAPVAPLAPIGAPAVSAPLTQIDSAYALAGSVALEARQPQEFAGLHNVFQLSPQVWSGGEPEGEEAFRKLAELGVKTIVSVDGKKPDAALAAKYGMRYVHQPIEYRGFTEDELLALTKTYRECEGPFFTHCFHGKHRGPAAAAIARLVIDGAPREQAIAEMRQWCGTAPEYEGLYRDVAMRTLPDGATSRAFLFDFPAARTFGGFRESMIDLSRRHDALKKLAKRDFAADPAHPDVDALESATQLADGFAVSATHAEIFSRPADFQQWLELSIDESAKFRDALREVRAGSADALTASKKHFDLLSKACNDCHAAYRNH